MLENIAVAVVVGAVVGLVVVEYSRWRYARMVKNLIKKLREDDEVYELVEELIRHAVRVATQELRPKELDEVLEELEKKKG
jgi:hypothetical protein